MACWWLLQGRPTLTFTDAFRHLQGWCDRRMQPKAVAGQGKAGLTPACCGFDHQGVCVMRKLFGLACLIVLALSVSASVWAADKPTGPCRMIDPTTCTSANELSRASGFSSALGHFVGDERASYFGSKRSLSSQALAAFSGQQYNVVQLSNGHYLYSACPARECSGNAAAIVVDEYGKIEGLGFSSFHCDTGCEDFRYLDIYVRKDGQDDAVLAALKQWGTSDRLREAGRPGADDGIDKRLDVHLLP